MQAKIDSKVFQEMIATESSYNKSLVTLLLALSTGDYIQDIPLLLNFKNSIILLQGISDDLLLNAEVSFEEHTSEKAHLLLRNQRVSLLTNFFSEYKNYVTLYNKYMEQLENNPKQFDKINEYFTLYKLKPGFEAHLIQPIQRGPRYQLLIAAAKDNSTGVTARNAQELTALEQLVKNFLFAANTHSAQASPYWFGKITYTLLWGNPEQAQQTQATSPAVVQSSAPNEPTHPGYQLGDLAIKPAARMLTNLFKKAEPRIIHKPADEEPCIMHKSEDIEEEHESLSKNSSSK